MKPWIWVTFGAAWATSIESLIHAVHKHELVGMQAFTASIMTIGVIVRALSYL